MKKILMISIMFFLLGNIALAKTKRSNCTKKENTRKYTPPKRTINTVKKSHLNVNAKPSRQTCTVYYTSPSGITYAATASSGWLLSNDQNSMDKACEKASTALYQIIAGLN